MALLELARRYWPAVIIAAVLAASHFYTYRFAVTVTQTRADLAATETARDAAFALAFAEAAARGEEKRQQAEADRVQHETIEALEQLQADYDRDATVADRLREQIKRYALATGRPGTNAGVPAGPAGAENPGSMLAVVLDKCVSRVRELAQIADSRGIKRQGAEDLFNSVRTSVSE